MKKIVIISGLLIALGGANVASAQGMMGGFYNQQTTPVDTFAQSQTTKDEAAGKAVWDKLQAKQVTCVDLKDSDFDVLGDYFMGQMMGSSHAAMNQTMTNQLGDGGETQMHITMGKRLSGCDPTAAYPSGFQGFLPMMGMMGGYPNAYANSVGNGPFGHWGGFSMMGQRYGWMGWGFLSLCILWWVFVALTIALIVHRLARRFSGDHGSRRALNALKERYAKGEISKDQFVDMKKTLKE